MSCCEGDEGGGCTCGQRALERGSRMALNEYNNFIRWLSKKSPKSLCEYASLGAIFMEYEAEKNVAPDGKTLIDLIDDLIETRIDQYINTNWHCVNHDKEKAEKIKGTIKAKFPFNQFG